MSAYKEFGYGIVDVDGNPHWSELCVCQDRIPLDDVASGLNDHAGEDGPYRVVKLYRRINKTRRKRQEVSRD